MVSFGYSLLSFRKEQREQRKYVHRSLVTAQLLPDDSQPSLCTRR